MYVWERDGSPGWARRFVGCSQAAPIRVLSGRESQRAFASRRTLSPPNKHSLCSASRTSTPCPLVSLDKMLGSRSDMSSAVESGPAPTLCQRAPWRNQSSSLSAPHSSPDRRHTTSSVIQQMQCMESTIQATPTATGLLRPGLCNDGFNTCCCLRHRDPGVGSSLRGLQAANNHKPSQTNFLRPAPRLVVLTTAAFVHVLA